jgi:hypothetical protein
MEQAVVKRRVRKPKAASAAVPASEQLMVVTPELLVSQFQNDYMQCTQAQKKSVKKAQDNQEKRVERMLSTSRSEWETVFQQLTERCEQLRELLVNTGLTCPEVLLGVPALQLDHVERVVYWARFVLRHQSSMCVLDNQVLDLLNEVAELKVRAKERQSETQRLSQELVAFGARYYNLLSDCVNMNAPGFEVGDVFTRPTYKPPFDRNDVYYFFPDLVSVVKHHNSLPELCVMEQNVPTSLGFEKLKEYPKPTVEHLERGCFIGLMVLTNLDDLSDHNDTVNYDNMCCSVGEQLSGTSLLPGKKFVTWYLGQYCKDNVMGPVAVWTKGMDYLFHCVERCPSTWNNEFVKAWKAVPGRRLNRINTCLLPGTKEVTKDTWGTLDTLDWIVRNVHFWAYQLNCYAPCGYNVYLNNSFHRTLFTELPHLSQFPLLWQYKRLLCNAMEEVTSQVDLVNRVANHGTELLRNLKESFLQCHFHMLHLQWMAVKETVLEWSQKLLDLTASKKKLTTCITMVQQSVASTLCHVQALSQLYKMNISVVQYQQDLARLFDQGAALLHTGAVTPVHVTLEDMVFYEDDVTKLQSCDSSWMQRVILDVGVVDVTPDTFLVKLPFILSHLKRLRSSVHPDRTGENNADAFLLYQDYVEKLSTLQKLSTEFFNKVR